MRAARGDLVQRKQRFVEALSGLSPQSRYLRFARPHHRFTDAELRYLTEIDYRNHMTLGMPGSSSATAAHAM